MVDVLLADSAVTAIIGSRIDAVVVRQETMLPALTWRRLPGGERTYSFAGSAGYTTVLVAMDAWATTFQQARTLIDAVRAALDAYASNDSAEIQLATVLEGGDAFDETLQAYGCGLEVTLRFLEV